MTLKIVTIARRPWLLLVLLVQLSGCAKINVVSDGADTQLMLRGNDPVAYHTLGRVVTGDPQIKAQYEGRLYLFGSERSRRHWEMDQQKNIALGDRYWEQETKDRPFRPQNWYRYTFRVPDYKTDAELEVEWQRRYGKPDAAPVKAPGG